MIARKNLLPLGIAGHEAVGVAQDEEQTVLAVGLHDVGIVGLVRPHVGIGAEVVDASDAACLHHGLYLWAVGLPVLEEDTRRSGHGQQIGVGGQRVLLERVLLGIGPPLGVVVLHERHRPAAVFSLLIVVAHEGPVAVVLLPQSRPVAVVGSVAHGVAELEVEGSARGSAVLCGVVYPVADARTAVPVLTH